MDRVVIKILMVVAAKCSENLHRLKGQGSPAMTINWGLVDPKLHPNRSAAKGKLVNIPAPLMDYVRS